MRSSYWSEDDEDAVAAACAAADLSFALSGQAIPADHALALCEAVIGILPWLASVPGAGLRLALGTESGNGWQRDEGKGAIIYLPRRARLVLRLPQKRLEDARALAGSTLRICGWQLRVGEPRVVALLPAATLYARHVVDEADDENGLLYQIAQAIDALGPKPRKIMCGRCRRIATVGRELATRSVMVAGLAPRDSLELMANGVGTGRLLGCGLFVPYKRPVMPGREADQ